MLNNQSAIYYKAIIKEAIQMNSQKNTIIFDLDGTLLDTLADLTDSVNYVMKLHGFPLHSQEQVREMVGNGIYVLLELAVPEGRANPLYEDCVREFQKYYKAHMQIKTGPFEGVMEMLDALRRQGYHLAVVSNKFDAAVKALCHDYFGDMIEAAIGESSSIAHKPAPDTVFEAMRQLSVKPENCIYVGDSDVDIETAKNSGIPCISVCWGFRSKAFLQAHSAAVIVSDTRQLMNCIYNL